MQLVHHLIIDHTTLELIETEIHAHLSGEVGTLPLPMPFREFVLRTRNTRSTSADRTFFTRMLKDMNSPTAPFGLSNTHGDGSGIAEVQAHLAAELAQRIRSQARNWGVSPASLFHVAWAMVLRRCSDQIDPVFGTVLFGRMHSGVDSHQILGLLMNTLPVRVRLEALTTEQCIRNTHQILAELLEHEHASLALAQRCSGVRAPTPVLTSLLNYRYTTPLKSQKVKSALPGIRGLGLEERSSYPLVMTVDDLGDSLDLIVYASRPVAPERVLAMMNRALELLVGALERDPDRQVQGLDMLPAEDRRALIKHGARFAGSYASETLAALLPGRQIVNLSEPIETPLRSMTEVELAGKIPERPVENATIYLLNQRLELTPMGVPGEVYVGGGLTQGYLDRAGLTSERFVASPFAKGERIYRTGDRARWQANGELKLLGRVDDHEDASTSRGQTDGIEAAFLAHRSVAQATAIVSADRQGEPRLIVYVVIRENESIDAITLRADLAGSLRDHAEPFDIVIVDAPGSARMPIE
jgi:non-ribosomal peptide synthetase component F